ncbi:MAG: hypothetical protein EBS55_04225 [Flavobacteriaceae bacterium]|nr:hypothetical protein [Flavobacteriaceae bacterium]
MKREYFGMLFIIAFVASIFIAEEFFGEEKVTHWLSSFIVVWVLMFIYAGQYSMRFQKAF